MHISIKIPCAAPGRNRKRPKGKAPAPTSFSMAEGEAFSIILGNSHVDVMLQRKLNGEETSPRLVHVESGYALTSANTINAMLVHLMCTSLGTERMLSDWEIAQLALATLEDKYGAEFLLTQINSVTKINAPLE